MMLAAFVAFLVVMRLLSIGLALVRFYGFVLAGVRQELRSEFGLLTRVTSTIPMRRIQMLTVHWGPLHRMFRRAAVRVDTAGGHGEQVVQAQRQWIVPIVREQVLPGLVRAILPVADTTTLEWRLVHPRAFRRAVIRPLFLTTALSLALVALLHWWTIVAWGVLSLWTIATTKRYVDSLRWALTDSTVAFRSGWLWRYLSIAPLAKVQAVSLHESPFDRRHGMATVLVDTAGGHDAPHRVAIPFLPREAAVTLRDHLVASAANTAFRW
jgi:putative membrane protein